MNIEAIFEELHKVNICKSAYDFSTNYLGKSKSYYGVLKSTKVKPSIDALTMLEMTLKRKASTYINDEFEIFTIRRNQLLALSEEASLLKNQLCTEKLNNLCVV